MKNKGINIDDKCFNEYLNPKTFEFTYNNEETQPATFHKKIGEGVSELLKISQFFFGIPAHNANVVGFYDAFKHLRSSASLPT